jgi:integrase
VIHKRGRVYWYDFTYNGIRYQKSTRVRNLRDAEAIEAAFKTNLARAEVGIQQKDAPPIPTLAEFQPRFMDWVMRTKKNEGTRVFYRDCYRRLVEFKPLGRARLNMIDEPLIEEFKGSLSVSATRCNRYLSTLRKTLIYACRSLKLIPKTPVITLYSKEDGAERECDYVFTPGDYRDWLDAAPEPLRSASVLAHDSGLCRGEMLALQRDAVHLRESPDERRFWGMIEVRRGLKRDARRRTLPITEAMAVVLVKLLSQSACDHVFTSLQDASRPLSCNTLASQHSAIKQTCRFHPDAGLHALRHTFLTEAGRHTRNIRALQKIAGHSRIETTMRYIHPDAEDMLAIASAVEQAWAPRLEPTTKFTTPDDERAVVSCKLQ